MRKDFKIDPGAEFLLRELADAGIKAWIVGGCVRDMLRGAVPKDWDITAEALPEEIMNALSGHRLILNGLKHGTVAAVLNGEVYEVTACRSDGDYADMRHPDSVEFTRSLKSDLSRRDFTVNAMAYNPDTGLADLFDGQNDLENKVLRCVGDAELRFSEDALRIMRAVRFSSELGFELEEKTAAAAVKLKDNLAAVSAERKYAEFKRLLCGDDAERVLETFPGIIFTLLPEAGKMQKYYHRPEHHGDLWHHGVCGISRLEKDFPLRFAYLMRDCGKPFCQNEGGDFPRHPEVGAELARKMLKELKAENETIDRVIKLIAAHDLKPTNDPVKIKTALRKLGTETYFDVLKLREADDDSLSGDTENAWKTAEEIIAAGECFSLKKLAVNGSDLASSGFRGIEIGEKLEKLLDAVIEGKCPNEKPKLLEFLNK